MPLRFTVLGSGSGGNASLVEADGFGLLIDAGLGPRQLAARFAAAGASWQQVQAVLLTHTHSDHWRERTFNHLGRLGIPVYCHADHNESLQSWSPSFAELLTQQLVLPYREQEDLLLGSSLRCRPIALRHDSGATFGFRFQGPADLYGQPSSLAYVADLGSWTSDLAQALADVDLLAMEFNHDVAMEFASGRSPRLIARVLGDHGHLSNVQAAGLLQEVLRLSEPGRLQHVVQLHLSRQCNHPDLAAQAAREILHDGIAVEVHTASQDLPGPTLTLGGFPDSSRPSRTRMAGMPSPRKKAFASCQATLPGLEDLKT